MTGLGDIRVWVGRLHSGAVVDLFCGASAIYKINWATGVSSFESIDSEYVCDSYITALSFEVSE